MPKRALGLTQLETSPLIFGGNVFGWTVDEPTSFALLDTFVEKGFNMIDTADMYSRWAPGNRGGESETIIGNWISSRNHRNKILLSTKVGMVDPPGGGLTKEKIIDGAEQSLRRLRTDRIDLYQSHVDDTLTPLDETLEAHTSLIKQGKVRYIGASNHSAERLRQALDTSAHHGLPRYETLQPLYNLHDRQSFEGPLEQLCVERKIGVITYSSLASGFLSGKYRSLEDINRSARARALTAYCTPRGEAVLEALRTVGQQYAASAAQIALAWLLARPSVTAAIVSATGTEQLSELAGALAIRLDASSQAILGASGTLEQQT